jgi:hypothetical protein
MVVAWAIGRLTGQGGGHGHGTYAKVVSQLASLGSIVFMPLISIVLALVYLKLRQMGGEDLVVVEASAGDSGQAAPAGGAQETSKICL